MNAIPLLQQAASGGSFIPLLALGLIFVIFYVFIIGPQKKEQKKTQEMIAAVQKGDKIITIGNWINNGRQPESGLYPASL